MQNVIDNSTDQWSEAFTLYNLTDPQIFANPYPWYEQLRRFGPVYLDQTVGHVCSGFAEGEQILKDERSFVVNQLASSDPEVAALLSEQMLFLDAYGTAHRQIRSILSPGLRQMLHEDWRTRLRKLAHDLLIPLQQQRRQEMDLVSEFAGLLPTMLNLELLGLSPPELQQFMAWNDAYEILLGLPCSDLEEVLAAMKQEMDYFACIVQERRRHLDNDLISAMIRGNLTDQQIIANCIVLLSGGYETTTHLITMALYWLSQAPDQLKLLRDDPGLIHSMLKEVMRFDGSSQFLARRAKADVAVGEKVISAGQTVFVLLAAANRDGRQFKDSEGVANPHIFDIGRPTSRHLGFGAGRHTCPGGPVAERLAEVAVLLVLEMFPDYQVSVPYEQLPWKLLHSNVRCVEHMPVKLKASS